MKTGQTTRATRFEDLPDILTHEDLVHYLPIGRNSIYAALKDGTIRSVRVGRQYLVPKSALQEFLGGHVE